MFTGHGTTTNINMLAMLHGTEGIRALGTQMSEATGTNSGPDRLKMKERDGDKKGINRKKGNSQKSNRVEK